MTHNFYPYQNEQFGEIRTIIKDNEPWFVGKDVAEVLGYSRTADAIRQHVDNEDKGVFKMPTPGGKQQITFIKESGLYSLILSSKLPQAKEFKRWVTSVVLPQIRKTGGYIPVSEEDDEKTILAKAVGIMKRTIEACGRKIKNVIFESYKDIGVILGSSLQMLEPPV